MDFPTANALDVTGSSDGNAFVTEIDSSGAALVYSTYFGGADAETSGTGIAVDRAGDAFLVGNTSYAESIPVVDPIPSSQIFTVDGGQTFGAGFLAEIATQGTSLVYSTFLGGTLAGPIPNCSTCSNPGSQIRGVAVDGSGRAYAIGDSAPTSLPLVNAEQSTYGGGQTDAILICVEPAAEADGGGAALDASADASTESAMPDACCPPEDAGGEDANATATDSASTTDSAVSDAFVAGEASVDSSAGVAEASADSSASSGPVDAARAPSGGERSGGGSSCSQTPGSTPADASAWALSILLVAMGVRRTRPRRGARAGGIALAEPLDRRHGAP